jgi:hypothetical protein
MGSRIFWAMAASGFLTWRDDLGRRRLRGSSEEEGKRTTLCGMPAPISSRTPQIHQRDKRVGSWTNLFTAIARASCWQKYGPIPYRAGSRKQ